MMKYNHAGNSLLIAVIIFMMFLGGCSTTGGTIGGLFPAPKFTKGKIDNNIYTSKFADFSIRVPFNKGSSAYRYMEIKEQYSDLGAYISFASHQSHVYRLEIAKKLHPEASSFDLEKIAEMVIENYSLQIEAGYKNKPVVIDKKVFDDEGSFKYFWKFSNKYYEENLYHYVLLQDFEEMVAIIWIQTSHEDFYTQALDYAKTFVVLN